jgi:hypothetical protein
MTLVKRREVIKRIASEAKTKGVAWKQDREGANHTVYTLAGLQVPIPRHNEIHDRLAERIFKECEPKLGKGWWR